MTTRTPIDRPLTDPERSLLAYLAARTVADQVPCPLDQAGAALKDLAGRGLVYAHGDAYDAYLTVDGHEIVHAARDWLAFMAMAAELDDAQPAPPRDPSPRAEA